MVKTPKYGPLCVAQFIQGGIVLAGLFNYQGRKDGDDYFYFEGSMLHEGSRGHESVIPAGCYHWMKAKKELIFTGGASLAFFRLMDYQPGNLSTGTIGLVTVRNFTFFD